MRDKLEQLHGEALRRLSEARDLADLDEWRIAYLGKKGAATQFLRSIGQLPPEERPTIGQAANDVKQALETAFDAAVERLRHTSVQQALVEERVDVTLPGRPPSLGRIHPSRQTLREIFEIFKQMGFQIYTGPDVETDELNFQLLNMPPGHPARDLWDTFYTTQPGVVLRTHTSPGQVRAMREYYPEPIRVILPGMCYRYEQVTVRHEMQFYQVEGLAVGRDVTLADLKGVVGSFCRQIFGPSRQVRFRCSHFPFTEPSVEVDMDCMVCNGAGCRLCKFTGWLEIMGAGMVHPVVLANGGYDPAEYSGFAFGMGPERIAMLKYGIDDIRTFFTDDIRFLEQFA